MFPLQSIPETREHTPSYYAASARRATGYAALSGSESAQVAILGGGFSGVNLALELAERGYDVALLEANRIGWGASGRNGGQIIGGMGDDPDRFRRRIGERGVRVLHELGFEGPRIVRERVERYRIECDIKWGYADVALKPRHMREFAEWQAERAARGDPNEYRLLDARELREFVNSELYLGGMLNYAAGHLHPLDLVTGEARAAESLGARLFEQTRVERIEPGQRVLLYAEGGMLRADTLVTCGNAYMRELVPRLARRVLPASSSIIATAPLPEALAREIMPGDLAVCDPRIALDYYRLSADRRLLFGGLANYTGLEPGDLIGTMRGKMLRVFPQLADVAVEYGWSGRMGIGLNRMPQLGRLAGNVYYIQAFSGHGLAPTHIAARVTAEAIAGDSSRFGCLEAIRHWPFPGGRWLRRPALAAGMLWFRLLDAL